MKKLVIKESESGFCYDVFERFCGSETDNLIFIGFSKKYYTINKVKNWLRTYSSLYSSRKCKILVEKLKK